MKRDHRYNAPSVKKPASANVSGGHFKTPQGSMHRLNHKQVSYSVSTSELLTFEQPNPSIQRDVSQFQSQLGTAQQSLYCPRQVPVNFQVAPQSNKSKRDIHKSQLVSHSFVTKRLSQPKNVSNPGRMMDKSFSQTIGDESYYSGEGYISKSMGGPKLASKSPMKNRGNNQSSMGNFPNSESAHIIQKKRNSQQSQASNCIGDSNYNSTMKQINNYVVDQSANPSLLNISISKNPTISTKSNSTNHKSNKGGSVTNKVSQSFANHPSFAERRLSSKQCEGHQNVQFSTHYENLMLQQLMKHQKKSDKEHLQKNLSLLSVDSNKHSQDNQPLKLFNSSVPHTNPVALMSLVEQEQQMSHENSMSAAAKKSTFGQRDHSFDLQPAQKRFRKPTQKRSKSGKPLKGSRSNSSKNRNGSNSKEGTNKGLSQGVCSFSQSVQPMSPQKESFQRIKNAEIEEQEAIENSNFQQLTEDHNLFTRLDQALQDDLKDKSSSQRVIISSKVLSEIIRRQDPVISSLLSKIKLNYESHIKQVKQELNKQKQELNFQEELNKEKQARLKAEHKIEQLSQELKKQQACVERQEQVMYDMKKQIQSYRREIIDISTNKKHHGKAKANKKDRNMKVPRLDLSKVRRDSEDGSSSGSNSQATQKFQELDSQGKEKAYQKYMQYIEDDSRFEEMGEESQESLIRQEELKERKNKIIQLLNGDVTDDEDGAQVVDQSSQGSMMDGNISYDQELMGTISDRGNVEVITASQQSKREAEAVREKKTRHNQKEVKKFDPNSFSEEGDRPSVKSYS